MNMEHIKYYKTDKKLAIIGDVHGCYDELIDLLDKLQCKVDNSNHRIISIPNDLILIFLGDFTDRGPKSIEVLKLVMDLVRRKVALSVCGNHDDKIKRYLMGNKVKLRDEMITTVQKLEKENITFRNEVKGFIENLPYQLIINDGEVVIAHGGVSEELIGKDNNKMKTFALYGDITGETHPDGKPVRLDWALDYQGDSYVIYGHTIVDECKWVNKTIDIDTGCFMTGRLTALLWPEKIIVSNIE